MSDNQQPKPYDAVLGGQNQAPEGAAVLGGIQGTKLRLSNENPEVRIKALHQALNYGESGIDLIIEALEDESPEVQIKAYSLLVPLSEQKVKRVLQGLESIEVVTVNQKGEIIQRQQRLAKYVIEDLEDETYYGDRTTLEMAYIPGGTFLMGASEDEKDSHSSEQPQHQITLQPFYMGKFPITQVQWEAVTKLPKIERDLYSERSYFRGENHPAERISWYDAVEFCKRLSKATSKKYRLPSEAEWEYACRAGTTTTFHYGETITSELANYDGGYIYRLEPYGKFRQKTTPVGSFPPNKFGLYDMHGNILEWCQDICIYNLQVVRGGSWDCEPIRCSSGYRFGKSAGNFNRHHGFRVACEIF